MKNSTMPWFWKQNRDYKNKIINLAKKRRRQSEEGRAKVIRRT